MMVFELKEVTSQHQADEQLARELFEANYSAQFQLLGPDFLEIDNEAMRRASVLFVQFHLETIYAGLKITRLVLEIQHTKTGTKLRRNLNYEVQHLMRLKLETES